MATQTTTASETVKNIMSTNVQTVDFIAPVADALRIMAEDKYNTLPVIDADRKCVGMLSRSDLTEALFADDQKLAELLEEDISSRFKTTLVETCGDKQVREVMTHGVTSVTPESTVKAACQLMSENEIHHLPVLNENGTLEGIVSTFDLIGWMAAL